MALHARNRYGRGQFVDVSMQACVSSCHGNARLYAVMDGVVSGRVGGGRSFGTTGLRLIYATADGYAAFFRLPDSYPMLATWLVEEGFPVSFDPAEWAGISSAGRDVASPEKLAEVDRDVEAFFASQTTEHLCAEGQRRGLMIAPVASPADLAGSEQLAARGFWVDVPMAEAGAALRFPGAPQRSRWPPREPLPLPAGAVPTVTAFQVLSSATRY